MMDESKRPYDVSKCVQVLKYIISKHPNPDVYNVLRMLYYADKFHLLEQGKLITPDTYVKYKDGATPRICRRILLFVSGKCEARPYLFDESIKGEILVKEDGKLENLTEPDPDYLAETNIECLDKAIERYGDCDHPELKLLSHDEIYDSVPKFNDEITVFHMANVLDKGGELTKHLSESYPYKIMF